MKVPSAAPELFRRRMIRAALVLAWISLGLVLFVSSRGHTLLLDNRTIEDLNIPAPALVSVSVDGLPPRELLRGDRDRLTLGGINHRIRVEFSGDEAPFEGTFRLPLRDDMYLLSIPRLIRGIEPALEVFRTVPERRGAGEEELPAPDELGM